MMKQLITAFMLVSLAWAQRPNISNVTVTNLTPQSCTVQWTTDIGSDSLFEVSTGYGPWIPAWSSMETRTTDKSASGVTTHTQAINTGLLSGNQYSIYLRSRPVSGGVVDAAPSHAGWYDGASSCKHPIDGSACMCTPNGTGGALPDATVGGGAWDFQLKFMGPLQVIAGYDVYIQMQFAAVGKPSTYSYGNYMTATVSGYPNAGGATVNWYDPKSLISSWNQGTGELTFYTDFTEKTAFHIQTTAATPPGTYTITFADVYNTNYPGVKHTYSYTLKVIAPPTFLYGSPSSYPAIPGIGNVNTPNTWLWGMVTQGLLSTNCTPGASGTQANANFYDGIRALQQAKAYDAAHNVTGNPAQWDVCIANRENGYVQYSNGQSPHGAIWSIYLASKGLAALAAGGDSVARQTLYDTADHSAARTKNGGADPSFIDVGSQRELTFSVESWIAAQSVGHSNEANIIPIGITYILGQVDQIINKNVSHELFLDGAMADVLIHYYQDNGSTDIRIPYYIKALADHIWKNYWITGPCSGYTKTNVLQTGLTNCFAYSAGMRQMGIDYSTNNGGTAENGLLLMIAPTYAWLFNMTGNRTIPGSDGSQCALGGGVVGLPCTYLQAGDSIWESGVSLMACGFGCYNPSLVGSLPPKLWDQNYRWSFDYVTWRSPSTLR